VNIVDLILLAVVSLFALRGYFKGLFRETFSLVGLVAGFLLAARYDDRVAALLAASWKVSFIVLRAASFVLIFFIIYFSLNLIGWLLHRSSSLLFLQGINRMGGVLVGAGKGAALIGLAILFLASTPLIPAKAQDNMGHSYLVPAFQHLAQQLVAFGKSRFLDWAESPAGERNAAIARRGA
jgi:membrane protein required for colicin V production